MTQLLVRKLDAEVKKRLASRAKRHGRSLEAEARAILEDAVIEEPTPHRPRKGEKGFGTLMHERFKRIGLTKEEKRRFDKAIEELWRDSPPRFVEFK
jgi:plasmid stability protein